jgi:hypothetical protein
VSPLNPPLRARVRSGPNSHGPACRRPGPCSPARSTGYAGGTETPHTVPDPEPATPGDHAPARCRGNRNGYAAGVVPPDPLHDSNAHPVNPTPNTRNPPARTGRPSVRAGSARPRRTARAETPQTPQTRTSPRPVPPDPLHAMLRHPRQSPPQSSASDADAGARSTLVNSTDINSGTSTPGNSIQTGARSRLAVGPAALRRALRFRPANAGALRVRVASDGSAAQQCGFRRTTGGPTQAAQDPRRMSRLPLPVPPAFRDPAPEEPPERARALPANAPPEAPATVLRGSAPAATSSPAPPPIPSTSGHQLLDRRIQNGARASQSGSRRPYTGTPARKPPAP